MGPNIKNATVAIEDSEFYNHSGFRPKSFLRAVLVNLHIIPGVIGQGGSTITQQVIKLSLLTSDKTIVRKLKEIILALKLEREYEKDDILGIYLNQIPYGGNVFGIQEASQHFLGKDPKDLTLAEAAYLASIPNAPTHFSPYGSYKEDLEDRKNLVLSRQRELGFITEEQFQQAKSEKVVWKTQQSNGIKAPHFVFFIKDYLEQKYGVDTVESAGLKVITTLDYNLQQIAEKAVADYTTGVHKQAVEKLNAALVAADPKTGQILVMVGSRNYFDKQIDGNFNVATALRQPGSSFKPYMYATAFKQGYTPDTVLFDVPTEFSTRCDPYNRPLNGAPQSSCYMPVDYERYSGPMDIRTALGSSINVPAVKMLYMVGIPNTIKTAKDMGITSLNDPSRYGLSLVLGGGEVKLLDQVGAYSVFANGGVRHPTTGILSVADNSGKVLESFEDVSIEVLPKNVTLQISDVLSDNNARRLTFSPTSPLYFSDRQVAAKTGTTNDFKDLWTIGYTPSLVAGIWAGLNDNTALYKGITGAPIWHAFMEEALKSYPNEMFEKPEIDPDYDKLPPVLRGYWQGGTSYVVDTISGKLATEFTPKTTRKEYVITDVHDILHWVNRSNPRTPGNSRDEGLYHNWETAVQDWWRANKSQYSIITEAQKPTDYDDVHTADNSPRVSIVSPANGSLVGMNDSVTVSIISTGKFPVKKMDVFLNNVYTGTTNGTSFTFSPNQIPNTTTGLNTLTAVITDTIELTATASVDITIN
jgi:membrane peptidoglycan carboxypeptidase